MVIEACVENFEEALKAQQNGANRIELCSRLDVDGLTPSEDLIRQTCSVLKIPVMVMIRPRPGDFVFSEEEVRQMGKEIEMAKRNGAAGLVFGLLTMEGEIDVIHTGQLAALAKPFPVTFHKAVDVMPDPVRGVEQLLGIDGITRILTSGGKPTAKEGAHTIRQMIAVAGDQITIIAAGRITRVNVDEIARITGASELHGRRIAGEL